MYNTTKSVISKKRLNSSHNIYTQYKRNMSYKYEKFAPQNVSKNELSFKSYEKIVIFFFI